MNQGHSSRTEMDHEVTTAVAFVSSLVKGLNEHQLQAFQESLQDSMSAHYKHHWYPDRPLKGNAYRCIRINQRVTMDPLFAQPAKQCGLTLKQLFSLLPLELTLWVDPFEVCYRIGEDGSSCTLYKGKATSSLAASPVTLSPVKPTSSQAETKAEESRNRRSINDKKVKDVLASGKYAGAKFCQAPLWSDVPKPVTWARSPVNCQPLPPVYQALPASYHVLRVRPSRPCFQITMYRPRPCHQMPMDYRPRPCHQMPMDYRPRPCHQMPMDYRPRPCHQMPMDYRPRPCHQMPMDYRPSRPCYQIPMYCR